MRGVLARSALLAIALVAMMAVPYAASAHVRWDSYEWPYGSPVTVDHVRFSDVYFANAKTGWVVGDGGYIFHTTDGGHKWVRQTSGTTKSLWSVDFIDASTGWVVGDDGLVCRTTNGGSTWSHGTSGAPAELTGVRFVDAKSGWAVGPGGTILHTADGGVTWARQSSGTEAQLTAVDFVDANTGWAIGGDFNPSIGTDEGIILHTTNGGATWTAQTSGTTSSLFDVQFTDVNTGWVVGTQGTILHTADGGSVWTTQTIGTTSGLFGVHFTDANNGWVVGSAGFGDAIFKTTNGGSSWVRRTTCGSPSLYAVYFITPSIGWVVGLDGAILHTTNGGVILSDPVAPARMKRNTRYTVYCFFGDDDSWITTPVRIYKERLVDGRWVRLGYVRAGEAKTGGKYSVRMALPYRGKWRLRAVMPEVDWSGLGASSLHYDYVTVY